MGFGISELGSGVYFTCPVVFGGVYGPKRQFWVVLSLLLLYFQVLSENMTSKYICSIMNKDWCKHSVCFAEFNETYQSN